jgi:ABC-type lipoprotein export system ATPase subunit
VQITKIKVNNFKSLVDFEIDLSKFNCIVGLNGSGKSTFLQFIDFLSQLMKGNIRSWLKNRGWTAYDLPNGLSDNKMIDFSVSFCNLHGTPAGTWFGTFDVSKLQCVSETIRKGGFDITIRDGKYIVSGYGKHQNKEPFEENVVFRYEGSMLSRNIDIRMPYPHILVKKYVSRLGVFDLLSPHFLRKRTRKSGGSIGLEGKNLSSYFFELDKSKQEVIIHDLVEVYPKVQELYATAITSGWKQLCIEEEFSGRGLKTEAHHINDGMLRIIAILAELHSDRQTIIFDEIENGINQELVEFLLKRLTKTQQQIVVTTHSPLFLNYLDDELACESVHYFYKTPEGFTRCKKFFSLTSTRQKLVTLGPCEVIADTDLRQLDKEIERLDQNQRKEG